MSRSAFREEINFKAAQNERVIQGEPGDRLNLVQEQMIETGDRYEILKEILKDEEFQRLGNRVLDVPMQAEARMRREGTARTGDGGGPVTEPDVARRF